ncbi:hypothetical protein C0991_011420 [Blastosporella zonata]|nr:hypothetical protein C0991_011420 [Blastosporella zonata]
MTPSESSNISQPRTNPISGVKDDNRIPLESVLAHNLMPADSLISTLPDGPDDVEMTYFETAISEESNRALPLNMSQDNTALHIPDTVKPPLPRYPPIWAQSRQEVCESFDWFRSYQGGVYHTHDYVKGYLLSAFSSK